MNIRRPIYEGLATMTVQTDSGTPAQIAIQIAEKLAEKRSADAT